MPLPVVTVSLGNLMAQMILFNNWSARTAQDNIRSDFYCRYLRKEYHKQWPPNIYLKQLDDLEQIIEFVKTALFFRLKIVKKKNMKPSTVFSPASSRVLANGTQLIASSFFSWWRLDSLVSVDVLQCDVRRRTEESAARVLQPIATARRSHLLWAKHTSWSLQRNAMPRLVRKHINMVCCVYVHHDSCRVPVPLDDATEPCSVCFDEIMWRWGVQDVTKAAAYTG